MKSGAATQFLFPIISTFHRAPELRSISICLEKTLADKIPTVLNSLPPVPALFCLYVGAELSGMKSPFPSGFSWF